MGKKGLQLTFIIPSKTLSEIGKTEVDYIKLLKPSGFFTYQQGLTFKNSTWRSLCVECFIRISEQTATFALHIID